MPQNARPSCEFDSQSLLLKLDVTIEADVEAITPVVERVMQLAAEIKCAEGKHFEIETALREALANAIVHGARNDPSKQIELCVACDVERGMLIVVRDPGPGFDPSNIPSPVFGENVYSAHGRGIFLINQLMDEVKYERNGTEIHMRKH